MNSPYPVGGITQKQKNARIKNFSKARIRAARTTLQNISDYPVFSVNCRKHMKMAHKYVQLALDCWEEKP